MVTRGKWLLGVFLVVVLDPYEGLDYEQINVYTITEECQENCIEVIYPEDEYEIYPNE